MDEAGIVQRIRMAFSDVQAVYLFGSFAGGEPWPASDVDIALLLPFKTAAKAGPLYMTDLRLSLEHLLMRDVDLINLREISTVFQHEIITMGKRLDCRDTLACEEFEMLVMSYYQQLNRERCEILEAFWKTGRAYPV